MDKAVVKEKTTWVARSDPTFLRDTHRKREMYCSLKQKKILRAPRRSGTYEDVAYDVPDWGDHRYGKWRSENEIMRPSSTEGWTITIRTSRRNGRKVRKKSVYLVRISTYTIIDYFKRAALDGCKFDFFGTYLICDPVAVKFPGDADRVMELVRRRFAPIVDRTLQEFRGTHEYERFSRYLDLKREVDAKIKFLKEEAKRAADEQRRIDDERARNAGKADADPAPTRKDRTRMVAMEMAGKFARAAKKAFHPDLARPVPISKAEKLRVHEKSIVANDLADDMMKLMQQYVDYEVDLPMDEDAAAPPAERADWMDFGNGEKLIIGGNA